MVLTGSNYLCAQFEEFIKKNIPSAWVAIMRVREYSKLYIYSRRILKAIDLHPNGVYDVYQLTISHGKSNVPI